MSEVIILCLSWLLFVGRLAGYFGHQPLSLPPSLSASLLFVGTRSLVGTPACCAVVRVARESGEVGSWELLVAAGGRWLLPLFLNTSVIAIHVVKLNHKGKITHK